MIASQIYHSDGAYRSVGRESFINLRPRQRSRVVFVAYCADFEKDNPSSDEMFSVSATPPIFEKIMRNINEYARQNPDVDITAAAQVSVWLVQGESPKEISKRFPFSDRDEQLARSFLR